MEKEEILKEAKKIIDKFHSALASVEKLSESKIEREKFEREEGECEKPNENKEFREIMLKNAPNRNGDCIEAERGKWV